MPGMAAWSAPEAPSITRVAEAEDTRAAAGRPGREPGRTPPERRDDHHHRDAPAPRARAFSLFPTHDPAGVRRRLCSLPKPPLTTSRRLQPVLWCGRMEIDELKATVCAEVDRWGDRLIDVAHQIHDHPELAYEEHAAHDL